MDKLIERIIEEIQMEKSYLQIGSIKLYNIKVIYNDNIIYEGYSSNLPEQYKQLKYNKIDVTSNLITLYIDK